MGPKPAAAPPGKKKKPGEEGFGELNREMLMIQITDLEEKLSRARRRCKVLEEANKHYQQQFEAIEDDRQDVVSFLKRLLEQKTDEIVELQERLAGIQQARETEQKLYEQEMSQLKNEFQETKEQLSQQLAVLGGKLNTLEEFRLQKEELLCKFSKLEAKLEEEQQQHKEELYLLDRKNILDKDRLKKDMLRRVNQIAADFRKVSNKQMADTTKRMMRENVSMNVTLTRVSEKTAELVEENNKLKAQHHSRQLKINMLEATELELVRKNRSHMRVIRLLNTKCNTQELMLAMYEDLQEKFNRMLDEITNLFKQYEGFQQEASTTQDEIDNLRSEIERLTNELNDTGEMKWRLEHVLLGIAVAIHDCLQLSTSLEPYDIVEAQAKRETLFNQLLNLLNTAVDINTSLAISTERRKQIPGMIIPNHFTEGSLGLVARKKQIPLSVEAEREDFSTDSTFSSHGDCICSTQFQAERLL